MLLRMMCIVLLICSAGLAWADEDFSDTDIADTAAKEVKIKEEKPGITDPDTYRIGRTNLRINRKSDDYNWNTADEDEAANPMGSAYGVEW